MDARNPDKRRFPKLGWDDMPLVHEAAADLIRTAGDEAVARAVQQAEITAGIGDTLSCEAWLDIADACAAILAERDLGSRPAAREVHMDDTGGRATRIVEKASAGARRAREEASEIARRSDKVREDTAQIAARSRRTIALSEAMIPQAKERRSRK